MDKLLNVSQVAERAGVSGWLVRAWIRGGELPHYRLGKRGKRGRISIDPADLERFLRSRRVETAPPSPHRAEPPRRKRDEDFPDYYDKVMNEVATKRRR